MLGQSKRQAAAGSPEHVSESTEHEASLQRPDQLSSLQRAGSHSAGLIRKADKGKQGAGEAEQAAD